MTSAAGREAASRARAQAMVTIVPPQRYRAGAKTPGVSTSLFEIPDAFYQRGLRNFDAGFLLDEAVRLFNYGAGAAEPGHTVLPKKCLPISSETLSQALMAYGSDLTRDLYKQIERAYDPDGTLGGLNSDKGAQLLAPGNAAREPYMKLLMKDRQQNAVLVPRLFCADWAAEKARANLINFKAVSAFHKDILAQLTAFQASSPQELLDRVTAQYRVQPVPGVSLITKNRIGDPRILAPSDTGALYVGSFAPDALQIGLTEKIVATLCCFNLIQPSTTIVLEADYVFWDEPLNRQIDKLNSAGPLAAKAAEPYKDSDRAFDAWRRTTTYMRAVLLGALSGLAERVPPGSRAPVQSDLLWGVILNDYIALLLVHLEVMTLFASMPFRQIHDGGRIAPLTSDITVRGLSGIMGVAFWEMFSGRDQPHANSLNARNCFLDYPTIKSGQVTGKWQSGAQAESMHVRCEQLLPRSANLSLGRPGTPEADAMAAEIQKTNGRPRSVDLIAAANTEPLPAKKRNEPEAEYRQRLVSETLTPSPGLMFDRDFAGYAINPPFNVSIYGSVVIPSTGDTTPLFTTWGGASRFSFGAKLECHLQTYVFGWIYKFLRVTRAAASPRPADRLVFTCACGNYGGILQPHITHRSGDGFDFSLWEGSPAYYCALWWPNDNTKIKPKQPRTFSDLRSAPPPTPLTTASQQLKAAFRVALAAGKPKSHVASGAQMKVKARLRELSVLRTEMGVPVDVPDAIEKLNVNAIVPDEALLCTWSDDYLQGRPTRPPGVPAFKRVVYREFLKDTLATALRSVEATIVGDATPGGIRMALPALEQAFNGWPVFPDEASHLSHHLGHLALILSLPLEIIWAAPVYHFRALEVVSSILLEQGQIPPWLRRSASSSAALEQVLPLPALYFLPFNHHHHWHVDFWKPGGCRVGKREISRTEYIQHAIRVWVQLGIDLEPFRVYLRNLRGELETSAAAKTKTTRMLVSAALTLDQQIEAASAAERSPDTRWQALTAMGERMAELAALDSRSGRAWHQQRQWPPRGSALHGAIRATEALETRIRSQLGAWLEETNELTKAEYQKWLATRSQEGELGKTIVQEDWNAEADLREAAMEETLDDERNSLMPIVEPRTPDHRINPSTP